MNGYGAPIDLEDTNVVRQNPSYYGIKTDPINSTTPTVGYTLVDHLITDSDIVKMSQTATTGGRKFDGNKLEYGLLPPLSLKAVTEILTIGAQKYERDNWKHVPDAKRRYFDAAMRHMWDWKCGEKYDEETNKNHLAHAICNLMFLLEKELLTE